MDPIKTIGQLLRGDEQRDAIHIAIMPVIAAEELQAGDSVAFVYGTTNQVKRCDPAYALQPVGVVDPFFTGHYWIEKGSKVWLFLKPGTITGLRHEWTHPDIDNPPRPKNEHENWLRAFADRWSFVYDDMISAASSPRSDEWGNYITAQGRDLHSATELGADHDLFWEHLQALTGQTFDGEHREKFVWSCTC
jgi:hypothetical protein